MNSFLISIIALACFFGGGLLGMRLRERLPEHHLADESRKLLETGLGIIGTIGGLVLGLLVGSAFGSYNAQKASLIQLSTDVVVMDRLLAHFGPQAKPTRMLLRVGVGRMMDDVWGGRASTVDPTAAASNEAVYDKIADLNATTDEQKTAKGQALGMAVSIAQLRWQMYEQLVAGISIPLLAVLIFWFSITFVGLGIFTRANTTVIVALFLAALAVSGAIFILQEMYTPFSGIMQISSAPMRAAYSHLDR